MSAPTPGSWRVVECSGLHEYMVTSDEWTVAEMCGERADAERHAYLVAAVPDVLAALKLYVDHFGDPLKVARAAIAKAEGQS